MGIMDLLPSVAGLYDGAGLRPASFAAQQSAQQQASRPAVANVRGCLPCGRPVGRANVKSGRAVGGGLHASRRAAEPNSARLL